MTEIQVVVNKLWLLRTGRWIGWVKSAADRLEELVFLVAARELPGSQDGNARLQRPDSASGPEH